jgi:preprotein translocase subunit SecF
MNLIRLFPADTKIPFMRWLVVTAPVSIALAVLSIVLFLAVGLNYGIDFQGGTVIEIQTKEGPADLAAIRSRLAELNLGDVQVQTFGAPDDVLIRVERQEGGDAAQQRVVTLVRDAFGDEVDFRRTEVVGPRVSGELARNGIIGVLVALGAILVYLWFRFEWQYAIGAVITTFHDILLTIGFFAILHLDFSLSSIAAILTILGYSLNDTVVVYDRIRENLRKFKRMPLPQLIDLSINETLSRTTMTSVTTLLALIALYAFGGEVISSFVLAMIFGIVVGTFSSIFISAPLLILLKLRPGRSDKADEAPEPAKAS